MRFYFFGDKKMHSHNSGKLESSSDGSSSLSAQSSGELNGLVGIYSNTKPRDSYKNVFPKFLIVLMVEVLEEIFQLNPDILIKLATSPANTHSRLFFPQFQMKKVKEIVDGKEVITQKEHDKSAKLFALFEKKNVAEENTALTEFLNVLQSDFLSLDCEKVNL